MTVPPGEPAQRRDERPPLAAYVDESVSADGRLYTMTAAVIDTRQARGLVAGLQRLADIEVGTGKHYFHTVRSNEDRVTAMTQFIAQAPGVYAVMTARAPVPARGQEQARQACLAELVTRLAAQGVASMTMDGRLERGPRPRAANGRDVATVNAARAAGLVPGKFQIRHVDDRDAPLVWIADCVGWQARRAIEYREPGRLAPLADRLLMVEAQVRLPEQAPKRQEGRGARIHGPSPTPTPTGGRVQGPPVPDRSLPAASLSLPLNPSSGLQAHLTLLRAQAQQRAAAAAAAGQAGQGAAAVRAVLTQLEQKVTRAEGDARRVPALDAYVTDPRQARRRKAASPAPARPRVSERPDDDPAPTSQRGPRL